MITDILVQVDSLRPISTAQSFEPAPLPDRYILRPLDMINGFAAPIYPADYTPGETNFANSAAYRLTVSLPDDLGIVERYDGALRRPGHRCTDGNADYCYIAVPVQVAPLQVAGTAETLALWDAMAAQITSAMLDYPDNGRRVRVPVEIVSRVRIASTLTPNA